jgi:hypothetical protein
METMTQSTDHWNNVRVDKNSLIVEVKAAVSDCGTDLLRQFKDSLQLTQNGYQKQYQRTQEGLKSIHSILRDHKAFQSGVSAQMNRLEDKMNAMDGDIVCVQHDTKGRCSSNANLKIGLP